MSESELSLLPEELRKKIDQFLSLIIEEEKEGYHNDLVSFSEHAAKIQEQGLTLMTEYQQKIARGRAILQEHLESIDLAVFTKCMAAYKEKIQELDLESKVDEALCLQEEIGLPLSFMDSSYQVAKKLLDEGSYEEAEAVFSFLHFLQPRIFEYLIGKGSCQQALGHFEEAITSYRMSLQLEPTNPVPFFLMASCLHELQEIKSCEVALDYCIELAEQEAEEAASSKTLLEEAMEAKKAVQNEKIA